MGMLADSLFTVLMSWVRALVNGIWALFSSENTTVLEFLGRNWMVIAAVMIAAGLVVDWLVWLIRWQPYHIWAQKLKRLLRIEQDQPQEEKRKAHAAVLPERVQLYREIPEKADDESETENELYIDDREAQDVMERADEVSDEELGAYPGMLYGTPAAEKPLSSTQRYSALTVEGPGSAEVARRRAEIEAWQQQMQDEARQRAQAERAAREAEEAARQAEQERLAREAAAAEAARQAEQERLAREAAAEEAARQAEQERLAQEAYAQELEEYERQKAQYERELAEYERQKAAYDAQMAQLAAQQNMQHSGMETAQELQPHEDAPARRRRAPVKSYSDYVSDEEVDVLPPPPAWPKETEAQKTKKTAQKKKNAAAKTQKKKQPHEHRLLGRVARMIEPQEDEITSYAALPPRVDMHEAYKPAKMPQKESGRKR